MTVSQTPSASGILYTIVFGGSLASGVQPLFVASQPNSSPPSVVEVTAGGGGVNEVQDILLRDLFDPFTLSFGGSTTNPIAPTADQSIVAAELNALASISGSGSVDVTQGVTVDGIPMYEVTFDGGSLAGVAQPLLVVSQPNSQPPVVSVAQAGGIGALDSPSGINTWSSAITLAGNTSIGSDTDNTNTPSTLSLDVGITESVAGSQLTKVGTGIAALTGSTSNLYTGLTSVNGGTLQLAKTGGALAVPSNLTVGNGQSALGGTSLSWKATTRSCRPRPSPSTATACWT